MEKVELESEEKKIAKKIKSLRKAGNKSEAFRLILKYPNSPAVQA